MEAMTAKKPKLILPLLLLAASVLAVYPAMTLEKTQQGSGTITIDADGQAFMNHNGKSKNTNKALSARFTLSGSAQAEGDDDVELDGLVGSLEIGSTNYSIFSGKGEVNKKGKVQINAKTGDGNRNLELVLHGNIQGKNVLFSSPESKLSSLYFLSLEGEATFTKSTTSTDTSDSDEEETTIVTITQNNTVTDTVTETVTQIQESTVTTTETANQTLTDTVTQTVTETTTQTVTNSTATVTVTETQTTTIANSTITVTTTVANSTLTVTQT